MKKDDQKELLEILMKNTLNMHVKINQILEILEYEEILKDQIKIEPEKDDIILKFDRSTYDQMCDLMDRDVIPFMGIA
jgi:signal transduction histidine kinase